jgi:hypothetical protein
MNYYCNFRRLCKLTLGRPAFHVKRQRGAL